MKPKPRYIAVALIAVLCGAAVSYKSIAQTDAKIDIEPPTRKAIPTSLKVFKIKHANAELLSSTIRPLFKSQPNLITVIAFDKRTNTVIARGPESELSIVEVVLLRLDEPDASK